MKLEVRTSDLGPRTSDFGLRTSDLRLQAFDFRPSTSDLGSSRQCAAAARSRTRGYRFIRRDAGLRQYSNAKRGMPVSLRWILPLKLRLATRRPAWSREFSGARQRVPRLDRKSTRLNSSHSQIS